MSSSPGTRRLLDQFAAQLRQTPVAPTPDQVHDLRVSIRRLSQALANAGPDSNETERVRKELKVVMRMAGNVRDCDITLKLVGKAGGSKRLAERLHRRRGEAERALILGIGRWTKAHPLDRWRDLLPAHAEDRALAISAALKKLFKRGRAAEDSDRKLHPLRIAAKKLRYTLELLHADAARIDMIKGLQTRLGDINDFETARSIAGEEGASKRMLDELRSKQDKKIRSFRRFWNSTFAGRDREWAAALQAAPSRSRRVQHGNAGRQGAA
ncbi:MAG: CHAD domain-containing protein [Acidobacteriia bacterium]|nr:CHAD domain-containing protein [Terriglobia bacterium]